MELGLGLPQTGHFATPAALRTVAVAAEAAGYASLWAFDRLLAPLAPRSHYPASPDGSLPPEQQTMMDPIVALTAAAALTERIRIGTNVLIAPLYSPLMLARTAATLDQISDGRFTLGLGIGWSIDEYAAAGVEQRGLGTRLEEILETMARIWRDDVVETETTKEQIAPCTIGFKPLERRVPVLLAAYTPAGLERIARRADGWTPTGIPASAVASMWAGVQQMAERYGRDPQSLRLVMRANIKLVDEDLGTDRPEFVGTLAQVRDDVHRAREAGADELILELQGATSTPEEMLEIAAELADGVPALV